jgi:hypothetical protein
MSACVIVIVDFFGSGCVDGFRAGCVCIDGLYVCCVFVVVHFFGSGCVDGFRDGCVCIDGLYVCCVVVIVVHFFGSGSVDGFRAGCVCIDGLFRVILLAVYFNLSCLFGTRDGLCLNGTITYKPHRQQRRQRAQAHNSTPYRRQQSFM